jgi:tRNA pseudouridine38-40 synthase
MRYALAFQYVGTNYHGWQIQPNAHSVQAELQKALSVLHQEEIELVAAGRTDTGVHAELMYAHFDSLKDWEAREFIHRLNSMLPRDIAVIRLHRVQADFHARFDAISRSYRYQICSSKQAFMDQRAYYFPFDLALEKMNQAAQLLVGEHDFSCFSKAHTQTFTNNCSLQNAVWAKTDYGYKFEVTANRFLRNMVRAMVGTLIEVGENKREPSSMATLLASKNRSQAGASAPAHGLYLTNVVYPAETFNA